jgi:hypothetical protein
VSSTNDGVDYGHGHSSFQKADKLDLIQIENTEDYRAVRYLIEEHCFRDKDAFALAGKYGLLEPERGKQLLKFLKDADGLGRVRINDLNRAYLRRAVSCEPVPVAWELLRTMNSS